VTFKLQGKLRLFCFYFQHTKFCSA